jgi:hypothetical protein
MSRPVSYELVLTGGESTAHDYEEIADRLVRARPAFESAQRIIEDGETRLFASFRGKYVRTGALRASLTQPTANGAIRRAHHDELEFGTSIFYAKFQKKRNSKKPVVLELKPRTRRAVAEHILEYIIEPAGV